MNGHLRGMDFWKQSLKRAFGLRFFVSVLLIAMAFFLDTDIGAKQVILGKYQPQGYECIASYVAYVLAYGNNYKLYLILMTVGYAICLPEDWNTGIIPHFVNKMGSTRYAAGQIFLCGLSGGMAAGMGFSLYLLILGTKFPLLSDKEYLNVYQFLLGMPYYKELNSTSVRTALLCLILIFFLAGVTWNSLAAGVSVWLKSRYLVLIFPYLLSRCYIELAKTFQIPNELRIDRWFSGMTQPFSRPVCLCMIGCFAMGIAILSFFLFRKSLKWRLEDGWN